MVHVNSTDGMVWQTVGGPANYENERERRNVSS
jgi:hypothetical protein